MGFLSVNRKRGRRPEYAIPEQFRPKRIRWKPKSHVTRSQLAPSVSQTEFDLHKPQLSPLERLPRELLEKLLIESVNFNLAQASMALASKLSRTNALELAIIREKLSINNGMLPATLVQLPFVTRELLERAGVKSFCTESQSDIDSRPYVPLQLEYKLKDPRIMDLVVFMVERGCMVESSEKVYLALAEANKWEAVDAMAESKHRSPVELVAKLLEAKQDPKLAVKLLNLSKRGGEEQYSHIWKVLEIAKREQLPEVAAAASELVHI